MVGLSRITVNPELVLTHELERDALLDVPEVAKGGCCLKWVVTLGTTIEAVPELSWPKVYECQFPNSSWKQCTAPSEVSSWSVAMWVPGFVDPRMLEMGLEVTEAVGEANVDAIRNLSALLAALRRLLLSASSSVISDSWGRFRLLWWGRLEAMASFALLSSSLRNRINSGSQFWLLLVVVKISKIRCFKSLGPLISEVAEVGGVGGRRLKPFLCHLPLKTKQILKVQIKTFKKYVLPILPRVFNRVIWVGHRFNINSLWWVFISRRLKVEAGLFRQRSRPLRNSSAIDIIIFLTFCDKFWTTWRFGLIAVWKQPVQRSNGT